MYASFLFIGLAFLALAWQQSVRYQRHFEVGQTGRYTVHFSGSAIFGDLDVTQTTASKVMSIDKGGGANVQYTIQSRKVLVNGSDISTKLDPPYIHKLDKNGIPIEGAKDFDHNDFSLYLGGSFGRDLNVGDVVPIKQPMPDGKGNATGSLKLLSLSQGEATFDAVITVPRGNQEPTVLRGKIEVSTRDATLDKIEATVENLDLGQAVLADAKYSLSRTGSL